jgi:membrane protease YdiL (CAAX protease family)
MLLALPVINATAWANEQLHFPESLRSLELALQQMEEGAERLTKALTSTTDFGILVLNILVMALVPALGEEMVFRGLIQPIAMRWTRRTHLAIWLTAFLFSALHLQFYGFVPRLLLGALLGYMYHWSGSLWVPILAHFANNAMALTLFFFIARGSISDEIEQFNATSGEWAVVGVAALALGAWLYVLCRKRVSAQPEPEANVGEPETDGE